MQSADSSGVPAYATVMTWLSTRSVRAIVACVGFSAVVGFHLWRGLPFIPYGARKLSAARREASGSGDHASSLSPGSETREKADGIMMELFLFFFPWVWMQEVNDIEESTLSLSRSGEGASMLHPIMRTICPFLLNWNTKVRERSKALRFKRTKGESVPQKNRALGSPLLPSCETFPFSFLTKKKALRQLDDPSQRDQLYTAAQRESIVLQRVLQQLVDPDLEDMGADYLTSSAVNDASPGSLNGEPSREEAGPPDLGSFAAAAKTTDPTRFLSADAIAETFSKIFASHAPSPGRCPTVAVLRVTVFEKNPKDSSPASGEGNENAPVGCLHAPPSADVLPESITTYAEDLKQELLQDDTFPKEDLIDIVCITERGVLDQNMQTATSLNGEEGMPGGEILLASVSDQHVLAHLTLEVVPARLFYLNMYLALLLQEKNNVILSVGMEFGTGKASIPPTTTMTAPGVAAMGESGASVCTPPLPFCNSFLYEASEPSWGLHSGTTLQSPTVGLFTVTPVSQEAPIYPTSMTSEGTAVQPNGGTPVHLYSVHAAFPSPALPSSPVREVPPAARVAVPSPSRRHLLSQILHSSTDLPRKIFEKTCQNHSFRLMLTPSARHAVDPPVLYSSFLDFEKRWFNIVLPPLVPPYQEECCTPLFCRSKPRDGGVESEVEVTPPRLPSCVRSMAPTVAYASGINGKTSLDSPRSLLSVVREGGTTSSRPSTHSVLSFLKRSSGTGVNNHNANSTKAFIFSPLSRGGVCGSEADSRFLFNAGSTAAPSRATTGTLVDHELSPNISPSCISAEQGVEPSNLPIVSTRAKWVFPVLSQRSRAAMAEADGVLADVRTQLTEHTRSVWLDHYHAEADPNECGWPLMNKAMQHMVKLGIHRREARRDRVLACLRSATCTVCVIPWPEKRLDPTIPASFTRYVVAHARGFSLYRTFAEEARNFQLVMDYLSAQQKRCELARMQGEEAAKEKQSKSIDFQPREGKNRGECRVTERPLDERFMASVMESDDKEANGDSGSGEGERGVFSEGESMERLPFPLPPLCPITVAEEAQCHIQQHFPSTERLSKGFGGGAGGKEESTLSEKIALRRCPTAPVFCQDILPSKSNAKALHRRSASPTISRGREPCQPYCDLPSLLDVRLTNRESVLSESMASSFLHAECVSGAPLTRWSSDSLYPLPLRCGHHGSASCYVNEALSTPCASGVCSLGITSESDPQCEEGNWGVDREEFSRGDRVVGRYASEGSGGAGTRSNASLAAQESTSCQDSYLGMAFQPKRETLVRLRGDLSSLSFLGLHHLLLRTQLPPQEWHEKGEAIFFLLFSTAAGFFSASFADELNTVQDEWFERYRKHGPRRRKHKHEYRNIGHESPPPNGLSEREASKGRESMGGSGPFSDSHDDHVQFIECIKEIRRERNKPIQPLLKYAHSRLFHKLFKSRSAMALSNAPYSKPQEGGEAPKTEEMSLHHRPSIGGELERSSTPFHRRSPSGSLEGISPPPTAAPGTRRPPLSKSRLRRFGGRFEALEGPSAGNRHSGLSPLEAWICGRGSHRFAAEMYFMDVLDAKSDLYIPTTRVIDEVVEYAVFFHHGGSLYEFVKDLKTYFPDLLYYPKTAWGRLELGSLPWIREYGVRGAGSSRFSCASTPSGVGGAVGLEESIPWADERFSGASEGSTSWDGDVEMYVEKHIGTGTYNASLKQELEFLKSYLLSQLHVLTSASLFPHSANRLESLFGVPSSVFPFLMCQRESIALIKAIFNSLVEHYGELHYDSFSRFISDACRDRKEVVGYVGRIFRELNRSRSGFISFDELCGWLARQLSSEVPSANPDKQLLSVLMSLRFPLVLFMHWKPAWLKGDYEVQWYDKSSDDML